ncbi:MAG TPA: hypothetical protein H9713_04785 [Candidatus Mediterraneibacter surreyensis]|nr:hypothetical protein [Candidatus Mediterraneibacter surreyensis]
MVTDTKELNRLIHESGLTKSYIANKLGISLYSFQLKRENKRQFTAEQIKILCELLDIKSLKEKERIFFAIKVDKMPTIK